MKLSSNSKSHTVQASRPSWYLVAFNFLIFALRSVVYFVFFLFPTQVIRMATCLEKYRDTKLNEFKLAAPVAGLKVWMVLLIIGTSF